METVSRAPACRNAGINIVQAPRASAPKAGEPFVYPSAEALAEAGAHATICASALSLHLVSLSSALTRDALTCSAVYELHPE